jgi:flavodoxin
MKSVVVYYSMRGTTKKIAERIAEVLGCDLEEIREPRVRKGIIGFLRSVREAIWKTLPPIYEPEKNIGDYELVVLGTPVWAGTMSSPMRSFLEKHGRRMKRTAFFCTAGGSAGRTLREMEAVSGHKGIAELALVAAGAKYRDVSGGEWMGKIEDFLASLKSKGESELSRGTAAARSTAGQLVKKFKTAGSKAKKTGSKIGKGIKKAASRGKTATARARKTVASKARKAANKAGSKVRSAGRAAAARTASIRKAVKTASKKKSKR